MNINADAKSMYALVNMKTGEWIGNKCTVSKDNPAIYQTIGPCKALRTRCKKSLIAQGYDFSDVKIVEFKLVINRFI